MQKRFLATMDGNLDADASGRAAVSTTALGPPGIGVVRLTLERHDLESRGGAGAAGHGREGPLRRGGLHMPVALRVYV